MNKENGFSLIEVLVATVILAVGILGIAGLQVVSLQQNRSSLLRAEALQIGNDILDRMRANPTQDYAPILFADAPPTAVNCEDPAANCSTTQMKDFDQAIWKCAINPINPDDDQIYDICAPDELNIVTAKLPGGEGEITVAAGVHLIQVRWLEDASGKKGQIRLRTRAN